MNMMAQRATIKSIDNLINERNESTKSLLSKKSKGVSRLPSSSTKSIRNVELLPIFGTRKFKNFPELVNSISNPFCRSSLNIAVNNSTSQAGSR